MNVFQGIIFIGVVAFAATSASEFEGENFLHESEEVQGYAGELESEHHESGYEYGGYGGIEEHEHNPQYHFEYTVHDPHTDDYKSHKEVREGDAVKGYYTLKEADGSLREVFYTADDKNGFQAVVTQNGKQVHPQAESHQQPVSHDSSHYF